MKEDCYNMAQSNSIITTNMVAVDDVQEAGSEPDCYGSQSDMVQPNQTLERKQILPLSCRHILSVMSFLGFLNVYCLRVNLSVALVDMVNQTYDPQVNESQAECPVELNNSTIDTKHTGEFNWDANQQGLILGAFFYGYITTQIPGGWLAERHGGKWLFGLGILCTSMLTLVTPLAARTHVNMLLAVRVLEGIGEGVTFPAMHAILAKWAPPLERSKMGTFIYAGAQMGTVVSMPVSGLLCKYGFAGGWPSVFYTFGTLGCVWFIGWCFLCYDSPAKHPRISYSERHHIEKLIGKQPERQPTPWLSMFTSVRVWAIITAHFTNNWGYYTLLTCLPTYMTQVLQFDISQNGVLSGLPYFFTWLTMTSSGQIADILRKRQLLSTSKVRKLFNSLGQLLPAVFLVGTGYLGCDRALVVAMIVVAVGSSGMTMSGYGVNHLDIAPPFAGTLMGLTNTAATIPGFIGPQIVGVLTNDNPSRGQWLIVFYISAAVNVFGTVIYLLFGSGEEQDWSKPSQRHIDMPHGNEDDDEQQQLLS